MSSIPEDLYLPILLRLPVKSTFICKCVCKSWLSLISDPSFAKTHLDFTPHRNISSNLMLAGLDMLNHRGGICSIDYNSLEPSSLWDKNDEFTEMCYPYQNLGYSVEIVGTSNGLICLRLFHIDISDSDEEEYAFFYCVWNPATHEYKRINKPTDEIDFADIRIHAFGYDDKSDDYKLVIGVHSVMEDSTAVYVCAILESASWKSVIMVPYRFCSGRSSGVLVNGDFHFLAERGQGNRLIVSLDIIEERFKEMEFSIELKLNANWFIIEAVLQGCLSVLLPFTPCIFGDDYYSGHVELWVMQDYGVQKSWTKRYVITDEMIISKIFSGFFSLRFISSFKNGEILFLVNDKLNLYDPKDASAIERDTGSVRHPSSGAKYLESLVSVNSGTYVEKGQTGFY